MASVDGRQWRSEGNCRRPGAKLNFAPPPPSKKILKMILKCQARVQGGGPKGPGPPPLEIEIKAKKKGHQGKF